MYFEVGKGCRGRTLTLCLDLERRRCRDDGFYCTDEGYHRVLLEVVQVYTRRLSDVRWVSGFGFVLYSVRERRDLLIDLLDGCEVASGWCGILNGIVAFRDGRQDDARELYRMALSDLSPEDVCAFTDLSWILPRYRRYEATPCEERDTVNDTIWWLSDPLWSVPEDSRWLEHMHRVAVTLVHDAAVQKAAWAGSVVDWEGHPRTHHPVTIATAWHRDYLRRRTEFGLERQVGPDYRPPRTSTPEGAMEYAFIPSVEAIDRPYSARPDHWSLESERPVEVASDPDWYYFDPLTQAIAVFERGEGKVVAVSAELPEGSAVGRISDRRAAGIVSPGPEEYHTVWDLEPRQRYLFMDTVESDRFMVGVEVLAPEIRTAARVREGVDRSERGVGRVRLSDLLLYRSDQVVRHPGHLLEAWAGMLGRGWILPEEDIGVFWEIYGLEEGEPHEVSVRVVPERGFFGRLAQAIGLGSQDAAALEWNEGAGADAGVSPRALDLGLTVLDPGRYTLEVTVTVGTGAPVTARREFEIRRAGG